MYLYVPATAGQPSAGQRLARPGLVVAVAPAHALISTWPGRLYRVAADSVRPGESSTLVPAADVLEEVDAGLAFGPHGDAVARVLDRAWALTATDAHRIATRAHPDAIRTAAAIWARWTPDGTGSPVGRGTYLAWNGIRRIAERHGAVKVDGDGEVTLAEPWGTAASSLVHATLACGAPDLLEPGDLEVLLAAFQV
jgi:hypothetical protein